MHVSAESAPPPAGWRVGEICFADLRVVKCLASGGTGVVYVVSSPSLGATYAVKRARFDRFSRTYDPTNELSRLLDLPEHPNLLRCRRFDRLGEGEWLIRSEYIDGERLDEWAAGEPRAPGELLDAAIQTGWAILAVHSLGLVHLDVKPANLVRTPEGVVKLIDFGSCLPLGHSGARPAVTAGYASPWHPSGPALARADVWSWGLSVLELFARGRATAHGAMAPHVLKHYQREPSGCPLPDAVVPVLERCFDRTDGGWSSMGEVCEALIAAYREVTGSDYPRPRPPSLVRKPAPARRHGTITFRAPGRWREEAREFLSPAGPATEAPRAGAAEALDEERTESVSSARAATFADLLEYIEIERLFDAAINRTARWFLRSGRFRLQKAAVHETLDDFPGAFATYDRLLAAHRDEFVGPEAAALVADAHEKYGCALVVSGDTPAAIEHFRTAVDRYSRIGAAAAPDDRASVHANYAMTLHQANQVPAALRECRTAIALFEQCPGWDTDPYLRHATATCYLTFARLLRDPTHGNVRQAELYLDKATTIYRELAGGPPGGHFEPILADCLVEQSHLIRDPDQRPARPFDDRAIEILNRHVTEYGLDSWRPHLARALREKARRLALDGEFTAAGELLDRAATECRYMVQVLGDGAYRNEWARVLVQTACARADGDDTDGAVRALNSALDLLTRLVREEGDGRFRCLTARAHAQRARLRFQLAGAATVEVRRDVRVSLESLETARAEAEPHQQPDVERECARVADILEGLLELSE